MKLMDEQCCSFNDPLIISQELHLFYYTRLHCCISYRSETAFTGLNPSNLQREIAIDRIYIEGVHVNSVKEVKIILEGFL